jgi:NAD(P)-dependent dehydrogenase (short-subunit alcohol dehydrogenase family)
MKLKGKIFVVTGGTGGLGSSVTRRLAQEGASVHVTWIAAKEAEALQVSLGEFSSSCALHEVDVLDEKSVTQFVADVIVTEGQIDGLCNLVGGYFGGMSVVDTDLDRWDFLLNLNTRSVLTMCKHIVPHMQAARSGKVVNVSARRALQGVAGLSAYAAAKAGVLRLTESLAAEVIADNIQVNAILPSTIDTLQNREASPDSDPSDWVSPDDIADVVTFLCGPESGIITGASIPVYGRA